MIRRPAVVNRGQHTWIHLAVRDAEGKTEEWMLEGGTPNTLLRRGLNKTSLPEGTAIVVDGYRAKNGSNRSNGRDLTFSDGRACSWDVGHRARRHDGLVREREGRAFTSVRHF